LKKGTLVFGPFFADGFEVGNMKNTMLW
jgi:hypothetical protein